ncbi:MAG: DUF4430 domain-containing protein [bacterium]|nr:DUF4430 domain-containing protein [bacterium]
MKTKNLAIIFILFLLITLGSGLVIFFIKEKNQPVFNRADGTTNLDNQFTLEEKVDEAIKDQPTSKKPDQAKPIVQPKKIVPAEADDGQVEKIQAVMLINGVEYRIAMKPGSSVYDLMSTLKEQNQIDFKSKDYSGLGFFIEEINGVKNNPGGMNWLYYINGKPAPVGISNYKLKNNDIIEWKYEKKSF